MAEEFVKVKIGEAKVEERAPPGPPAPPPRKLLAPEEWAEQHRSVKRKVDDYTKKKLCVTPDLLSRELDIDASIVDSHMQVMTTDKGAVKVAEVEGKPVYCSTELIHKLIEDLKKLET